MAAFLAALPEWIQYVVVILGCLSALCTAVSTLARAVSPLWTAATRIATWTDKGGLDTQWLAAKLTQFSKLLGNKSALVLLVLGSTCLSCGAWSALFTPTSASVCVTVDGVAIYAGDAAIPKDSGKE